MPRPHAPTFAGTAEARLPPVAYLVFLVVVWLLPGHASARTVYECMRDDTLSLATAPEPGSRCLPRRVNDAKAKVRNFWGDLGPIRGPHYQQRINGRMVISTRAIPGWTEVDSVADLTAARAWEKPGGIGRPRLDAFADQFRMAARRTGVDEAWLRAIAHAESGFDARAVSPRGARGLMQLMPPVARDCGLAGAVVADPFSSKQSIECAARHLRVLMRRYRGDMRRVLAAYNAGMGAVDRFGGVPPFAETQAYVEKVEELHALYRDALARSRRG